jgi:adenylate cyclase
MPMFDSTRELPPHLAQRLESYDRMGEVTIKLVQLAVIVFFGLLYFTSPKTDAGTPFRLVPYAIAIYSAASLVGLITAMRSRMPDWAVYASTFIDVGLLLTLIWSFHIQYVQPAAFSLKAPTFVYLFIFICLRALRFETRFVLVAGLASIAGWLALVGLAFKEDGMESITRDYTLYLTSNRILVGAEIDKVAAVATVTLILWFALRQVRRLLLQATADAAAVANFSKFFDSPVANRISAAKDVAGAHGELREAAILLTDLRGFTEHTASLPPAETMSLLAEYQREVSMIVRRHGGSVDKYMGDGILISFGATQPHPAGAASALRAADELVAASNRWPTGDGRLSSLGSGALGVSVAAGPVIFGTVGDSEHLEFTVIGSTVNLAAKLEKLNKRFHTQALTLASTLKLALRQGYIPSCQPERLTESIPGIPEIEFVALHRVG